MTTTTAVVLLNVGLVIGNIAGGLVFGVKPSLTAERCWYQTIAVWATFSLVT